LGMCERIADKDSHLVFLWRMWRGFVNEIVISFRDLLLWCLVEKHKSFQD